MKISYIQLTSSGTSILMNKLKSLVVITFCFISFFSCNNTADQHGFNENQGIKSYKTITIQLHNATLNTDYPASIQGLQNIEIRPKIDGFIEKIFVDEGSIVKKGQLLFKVNAPQYEQEVRTARAGIKTAEAEVSTAKMQVEKVKPLVEKDIISHFELESAQNTLQSKEAMLAQANAAYENAKINLNYTTIVSPVDGVIGSLPYKLGSLVSSTTAEPLTTVYNTGSVYAYFSLNEKQLLDFTRDSTNVSISSKIKNMPPVTLILSDGSVYEYKGKVETINGLINTTTGSANFRAVFNNPKGLLRSGGSASVRITKVVKDGVIVPQNLTYQLQDKRFIFLVDSKNKVKNTAITVTENTPGQYYIVTSGLKVGDKIIAEPINNIREDTEIKPEEINGDLLYKDLK